MKYLEKVTEDVKKYIRNEYQSSIQIEDLDTRDPDNVSKMEDRLWAEDSITGNASGSYTCNRWLAMQYAMEDMDTVIDACVGFGEKEVGKRFLNGDWEWFDVTARVYVLYSACEKAMDDLYEEYTK